MKPKLKLMNSQRMLDNDTRMPNYVGSLVQNDMRFSPTNSVNGSLRLNKKSLDVQLKQ